LGSPSINVVNDDHPSRPRPEPSSCSVKVERRRGAQQSGRLPIRITEVIQQLRPDPSPMLAAGRRRSHDLEAATASFVRGGVGDRSLPGPRRAGNDDETAQTSVRLLEQLADLAHLAKPTDQFHSGRYT